MKNKPLVTVIVPSYNHSHYIKQCIDSIINQTYTNIDLVVIDDGSTDSSPAIIQDLATQHDFTFISQKNQGVATTLNNAITNHARGEYISFCASDDYYEPRKVEAQVSLMESNKNIMMCFGKSYVVDEHSNRDQKKTKIINKNLKGGHVFHEIITMKMHPPVNYMFRTKTFQDTGPYLDGIWTEDFYMNLKIASRFEIGFIDEYIHNYRIPTHIAHKFTTTRIADSHLKCISEYHESKHFEEALRLWHFRNFVWYAHIPTQKKKCLISMIKAARYFYRPSYLKAALKLALTWK